MSSSSNGLLTATVPTARSYISQKKVKSKQDNSQGPFKHGTSTCNTRNARDHARQGCWRSLVLRTAPRCCQRPFVQGSSEKVLILFPCFQRSSITLPESTEQERDSEPSLLQGCVTALLSLWTALLPLPSSGVSLKTASF